MTAAFRPFLQRICFTVSIQPHSVHSLYVSVLNIIVLMWYTGLGLLARACLLLRLEDARAGLLYSQYHGILAACTAGRVT